MPTIVPRETTAPAGAPQAATLTPVQRAIAAMNKQPEAAPLPEAEIAPATQSATPEPEPLSPKLIELARREKAAQARIAALKTREDALAAKEAEYKTSYIDRASLTANPLQALLDAGLSHDQIMQQLLNGAPQKDPTLSRMEQELKAIKDAQEAQKLQATEAQKKQYEAAVNHVRNTVKMEVSSNPLFESVKAMEMEEVVVEIIKQKFETDGVQLTALEAAELVENDIIEQGMKYAKLAKVQAKLNPVTEPKTPEATPADKKTLIIPRSEAPAQPQQPIKTLTNAATAAPSRPLSDKDRRARAIAAFEGRLK